MVSRKDCGICGYAGKLKLIKHRDNGHPIDYWQCPECKSQGRQRLIGKAFKELEIQAKSMLYCSPMRCLDTRGKDTFDTYVSIDRPPRQTPGELRLGMCTAQLDVDLVHTPFLTKQFDFIVCSNVLDYIKDEQAAIKELFRILCPGGTLFLVAPIYGATTQELDETVFGHWRRPGMDYYARFYKYFSITLYTGENEILAILKRREKCL